MKGRILLQKLTIVIGLYSYPAVAQTSSWDSTYRPNLYQTRVGQFKSFKDSPDDIIFLGNSITSYANWDELLRDKNAKNRGIPGDITFGVIERLDEITEGKPAKLFVLIGINDIGRNIPDSIIVQNYQRIIRTVKAKSPETKIYFHTILPVNNTFNPSLPHFNKDQHILNVNEGLHKLAQRENIVVIDLYRAFVDTNKRLKKDLSFDGLHLNDKGYLKWAAILGESGYLKK